MQTKCAIIIVGYNSMQYLEDCMGSVFANTCDSIEQNVVFVDNASTDASLEYVKEKYPKVHTVRSEENLGFTGGNNLGWEYIKENLPDTEFVVLLNPDTIVAEGWLGGLEEILQNDPTAGIVQSKLMLWPDKNKINTVGNSSHFLGYGFVNGYLQEDKGQFEQVNEIGFASGAACMIKAELLKELRLFDPEFFMYCEDTDLSFKIRMAGYKIIYSPKSLVYHKYNFQKNFKFYYFLERNRTILILTYYRLWTILLIIPMMILMEAGQWLFAWQNKVFKQKLRAVGFFLTPAGFKYLLTRRRQLRKIRKISDRSFTKVMVAQINFPDLQSPLLKYIANPILQIYWSVIRFLIF